MSDGKQQLKALGLRFARALQMTVKTAVMFTVEHQSVQRPILQSFQFLNTLLKETGQFTFGFVDNQVMLNNLLTADSSLRQLETEFLKRGVAAVTFEPGLTLGRYKKIVSLLSINTKAIDEVGGLLSFLELNEVEGARILPAAKNQKKDEHGDTIIETDSEAYILSKQMADEQAPRDFLDSIDALLESACFDPSMRADVLSDFAARGVDGTGYGVPVGVPNIVVVNEGDTVVPASDEVDGEDEETLEERPRRARGQREAENEASASLEGGGPGYVPGAVWTGVGVPVSGTGENFAGAGFPAGSFGGFGVAAALGRTAPAANAQQGSFIELVEASVQRSLQEEKGNPHRSYVALARILRNMGVDKVLSQFPAERRDELATLPPERLAAEYIEDTALQLAGEKLKAAGGQSDKILVEEDVVRVLARSLQATQMADRLAQKLAKFVQDYVVPPHIQEKIREELHWTSLSNSKKYARLMEIKHYSPAEFRRFLDLLKELISHRETDRASLLASHYFDFLDEENIQIEITELSRVPELIRNIPLAQVGFAARTTERLARTLLRDDLSEVIHMQTATALTVLSQSIAAFEDFQDVLAIGIAFESSIKKDSEKHKKCCGTAVSRLLPQAAIERIIELFLQQRNDSAWCRIAATLLRCSAPGSIESVFNRLMQEEEAKNRLALVRLVGQLGPGSIAIAYRYLNDERWYVVRNICGALAELKDPDLADHIGPALEHPDVRVQQAALKALVNSRTVRAAPVLAASLPKLAPKVLDQALDELMFLRHVNTIPTLEEFISAAVGGLAASTKAVQILSCIDDDEAMHALVRLFRTEHLDNRIRRSTLGALCRNASPIAVELLQELAASHGPLGEVVRSELEKRKAQSSGTT
jgi:hypothetical protein